MVTKPPLWPTTFKEAFCDRYRCTPDLYEREIFWRCLYRHALPVAAVIYWCWPDFFKEDLELIREIESMNNPEVFRNELNFFYGRNQRDKNWVRRTFYIRLSAKRLLKLKNDLFNHAWTGLLVLK